MLAEIQGSLFRPWDGGFGPPRLATVIYGRWWQLETWLRSLCYVELRAKYGAAWSRCLNRSAERYSKNDTRHTHMASPDAHDSLAYMDASALLKLIADEWDIFSDVLLHRPVWEGRMDELLNLRNRIGHCRRPHGDDLARLEQMLRDLESGAYNAVCAFNNREMPMQTSRDPMAKAWRRGTHPDAQRLLSHAERKYDVGFRLEYSWRPWRPADEGKQLSGESGVIWHGVWISRRRNIDFRKLWNQELSQQLREQLIFVWRQTARFRLISASQPWTIRAQLQTPSGPASTRSWARWIGTIASTPTTKRCAKEDTNSTPECNSLRRGRCLKLPWSLLPYLQLDRAYMGPRAVAVFDEPGSVEGLTGTTGSSR